MFAWDPYADKDDSRDRSDYLLNDALYGWLGHLLRGVAYRAIRMRQSIRMKVGLLNRGTDEEKNGAHDGEQNVPAQFGCSILPHI